MMIGAPDMALPRMNNWSFWILPFAFAMLTSTLFMEGGAPNFGWTFYAPLSTTYAVLGVEGLAPYFFETEAHLFISDEGDVSARIRQENDFLLTQKLILQPYIEANLYAQDVPELDIGAGLSDAEFGLQTRYEYTRGFAPYVDVRYERKFGETSSIAKSNGEENDAVIGSIGLKLLF